jgi:hypothetical protein
VKLAGAVASAGETSPADDVEALEVEVDPAGSQAGGSDVDGVWDAAEDPSNHWHADVIN